MSMHAAAKRLTAPDIAKRKGGEPIVALTSYHAHTAELLDSMRMSSWSAIPSAW